MQDQQEVAILKRVSSDLREMRDWAENAEYWMGVASLKKSLIRARDFIDKLEMLTELCVYRPNRVLDLDDKKKKKENKDDDDEDDD
jgi:hypothetical protein